MTARLLDTFRNRRRRDGGKGLPISPSTAVDAQRARFAGLPFFEEIEDETFRLIEPELEWQSIAGGEELYRRGDKSRGLYVVRSGCLGVVIEGYDGRPILITQIHPGQSVGEMSLIAGMPYAATVIALRDSEICLLKQENFLKLVARVPSVLEYINQMLIKRLQMMTSLQTPVEISRSFAVVPISKNIDCSAFTRSLHDALSKAKFRVRVLNSSFMNKTVEWFCDVDCENDVILYEANAKIDDWTRLCFRQADRVLLLADAEVPLGHVPPFDDLLGAGKIRKVEAIFLQPPDAVRPRPVGGFLSRLDVDFHCHVRRGHVGDMERIARLLTGRAVSLVLSGGGARGFAHIGAVKAIREFGIPIDIVCGTSMGAIVGAGVAMDRSDAEIESRMHRCFVETNPLSDITLPIVSLVKGMKVSRLLRKQFGDTQIEDMWRPLYCVTANLTSGEITPLRRGLVRRALRATVAIPGLLPPIVEQGDLLADGGIINNFPVDVAYTARRGPIIGVDVGNYRPFDALPEDFDEKSLFWLWRNRHKNIPGIISLLMRVGTLNGDKRAWEARRHLSLLIEPTIPNIELREWGAFDKIVRTGYEQTAKILETADTNALTSKP